MSIFTKQSTIAEYPTKLIVKRESTGYYNPETKIATKYVNLTPDDILCKSDHLASYSPNSCMSYALENNECPIKSYQRAVNLGHEVYWINQNCTVVHNGIYKMKVVLEIDLETIYKFQGKFFKIIETPNDNLAFSEIKL